LGQRFPIALSRNTLGLIHALEGQYEWGWRECQLALSIFEELELPRGIGLACNALGFVLRHQGEAWNVKLYDPDRISALFQQAEEFLNQAVNIFSEQVQEPIRLWEAYNELGSLDRAWGNLLQQEDHAAALKRYEEAVSFQLKALEVAQLHDLHFQEADTCDDLAQVFADQRDFDKAHRWLQRSLSLVPEGYTLAAGKGFEGAPEPGEAYWLILGKTHQRLGIWALPSNGLANPSHDEWAKKVEAGFQHFALAAAYFERYWPNTIMLSRRLRLMARYLHKSGSDLLEAKQVVNQVATDYAISLATFLDTLEVELNRPV
jgi:tetratricopeptide (TPR) repeat protein